MNHRPHPPGRDYQRGDPLLRHRLPLHVPGLIPHRPRGHHHRLQRPGHEILQVHPRLPTGPCPENQITEGGASHDHETEQQHDSQHTPPGDGRVRRELLVWRLRQICDGMPWGDGLRLQFLRRVHRGRVHPVEKGQLCANGKLPFQD